MSPIAAACPGCGATVTFSLENALVTVCAHCRNVVARGDRGFESLGRVGDLLDTRSPLAVHRAGRWKDMPFTLSGRAQIRHAAGGVWDEWYAAFDDGRWGWLAEAQGRFVWTFEVRVTAPLPRFDDLKPGWRVPLGGVVYVVVDRGEATYLSAEGDIPFRLVPQATYRYVDLSGPNGAFATIDLGDETPRVFAGREVTLAELGLARAPTPEREARRVAARRLACPRCDGALELKVPDRTERVVCPYCGAYLDVNEGNLVFLKAAARPAHEPPLPLGAQAKFEGETLILVGYLQRSVTFDRKYFWDEYLLYHPRLGFRWLVCSDGHWSYVTPVAAGDVSRKGSDRVRCRRRTYRIFQKATATVETVLGELYWKVEAGERVEATDFVAAPYQLTCEASEGEVNWSHGLYVSCKDIERAFGVTLERPQSVAPNQPFLHKGVYPAWAFLLLVGVFVNGCLLGSRPGTELLRESLRLEPQAGADKAQVVFRAELPLAAAKNIKVSLATSLDNAWMYVAGDFFSERTGLVRGFDAELEHYSGYEGGEYWSEGSGSAGKYLSALPAGDYTLRLEVQRSRWSEPAALSVLVEQGAPNYGLWLVLLAALTVVPVAVALWHASFNKRRWQDSEFSPYGSEDDE